MLVTSTATAADEVPAGQYTLDRSHASLLFRVNHLGFSRYTARFKRFDATLKFDPRAIETASVIVTVDAASIETDFPDPLQVDFNEELRGPNWLDAKRNPQIVFASRRVLKLTPKDFQIEGDLTLRGVTRPVVLAASYNGGYAGFAMDPNARIGFSAHGTLKRSQFGMTAGIPPPGSTIGVGDEVEIIVEAEFSGPPLAGGGK